MLEKDIDVQETVTVSNGGIRMWRRKGGLKGLKNLPERICNMVFTFGSFNERLNLI